MAVLRWPRITRSDAAPADVKASRTIAPWWPQGWRWIEIATPEARDAAATALTTRASLGRIGSDVPISLIKLDEQLARDVGFAGVCDPRLVDRLQILPRAEYHVDARALRDLAKPEGVPPKRSRRQLDDRAPAGADEGGEFLDGRRDVGQAVVVGVGARVPARLRGDRGIPRAPVR
jgi:hypothetical protein